MDIPTKTKEELITAIRAAAPQLVVGWEKLNLTELTTIVAAITVAPPSAAPTANAPDVATATVATATVATVAPDVATASVATPAIAAVAAAAPATLLQHIANAGTFAGKTAAVGIGGIAIAALANKASGGKVSTLGGYLFGSSPSAPATASTGRTSGC